MSSDRVPYNSKLATASDALDKEREAARKTALDAIRSMLAALATELCGEELRGLPNLAGSHNPYRAISVRTRDRHKPLEAGNPGTRLVLATDGKLHMARRSRQTDEVETYEAADDDLVAEDVERVARAIAHASRLHIEACEGGRDRYAKLSQLAARLLGALRKEEEDADAS